MKYQILQPETLNEISLLQYQKFMQKSETAEGHFLNQIMISLFCGIPLADTLMIAKKSIDEVTTEIGNLFEQEPELQRTFKIGNKEFGFIPNLEEMSFGEFIDLDTNLGDWQKMHKAMATLYRPITVKNKDKYQIEEYEGTDKYSEVMQYAPLGVVMGAMVFFWNLSKELIKASQASLTEELMKETIQLLHSSDKNGDGIAASTHSLMESLMELSLPQDISYSQHSSI